MSDALKAKIAHAGESLRRFLRRGTDFKTGDVVRDTRTGKSYTFKAYHEDSSRTGLVEVQQRPGGRVTISADRLELIRSTR